MGQQNPYDPSSWSAVPGQPWTPPGALPPTPKPRRAGLPKIFLIVGGLAAAGLLLLFLGNLGSSGASPSSGSTTSTHYMQVVVSSRGFSETIFFKIVSTNTEKQAFVDGFAKGIAKTSDITSQVEDLSALPANAVYVCQINMSASASQESIQIYAVSGDNLSRDIAQGGCDGGNAAS